MLPWERRLADLAHLLRVCHSAYWEPDLFRMNTNQFLQTARTVTFIINKHKASIKDFDPWYQSAVIDPWSKDPVMSWAKDSRNVIEKEGDLELYSHARATLIASYLSEQDALIKSTPPELLRAGVKKLIRLARKQLPTGIEAAAVIKIERRWVASSLKDWELLQALTYIYTRHYQVCMALAEHMGHTMAPEVPTAGEFEISRDEAQKTAYVKLSTLESHSLVVDTQAVGREEEIPEVLRKTIQGLSVIKKGEGTIDATAQYLSRMAEATFMHFHNHVPMLFLYDNEWMPIDMVSTNFTDQADKYIFWRRMAERVQMLKARGVGWIAESWIRDPENYPYMPIGKLPITGEQLNVVLIDRNGDQRNTSWSIVRKSPDDPPSLELMEAEDVKWIAPNYLVPIRRALGLPDGKIF